MKYHMKHLIIFITLFLSGLVFDLASDIIFAETCTDSTQQLGQIVLLSNKYIDIIVWLS